MHPSACDDVPLVCPACRTRTDDGWSMFTVEVARTLRADPATDELLDGLLACRNCARRYPVLDGIPVLLADPSTLLGRDLHQVVEGAPLHPELLAALVEPGPDASKLYELAAHASLYLDSGWGDRATPPPDGERFGFAALAGKLAEATARPVARAVELGVGAGRGLAEIARGATLAVGIDTNLAMLRRARRILAGERLDYGRRVVGRIFAPASVAAGDRAAKNVVLVCGDALDPPVPPRGFDRVVALNLLDAVPSPPTLLAVLDGLLETGGELVLAAPFAWNDHFVREGERIGRDDPAAAVAARLRDMGYRIVDECDVEWRLRSDARLVHVYRTWYACATKT